MIKLEIPTRQTNIDTNDPKKKANFFFNLLFFCKLEPHGRKQR